MQVAVRGNEDKTNEVFKSRGGKMSRVLFQSRVKIKRLVVLVKRPGRNNATSSPASENTGRETFLHMERNAPQWIGSEVAITKREPGIITNKEKKANLHNKKKGLGGVNSCRLL